MMPGTRINTAVLDCHTLSVEEDGSFEILIAPEKPADYQGNFMLSRCEGRGKEHVGSFLTCRELFHDWENEDLLDLEVLRLGCELEPRLDSAAAIQMMDKTGTVARHQVHFWNAFNTITLETYGKTQWGAGGDNDDKPFMPINDMNSPNALGIATGGGQSTNIYAGGVYQLDDNEALLIESAVPVPPSLSAELIRFDEIHSRLPAATATVTAADRSAGRLIRHRHIQRRYRQY